jgi:hypothetical protein
MSRSALLHFAGTGAVGALVAPCCGPLGRLKAASFHSSSSMRALACSRRNHVEVRLSAQSQFCTVAASVRCAASGGIDDVHHLRQACVGTEEESDTVAATVAAKRSVGERLWKERIVAQTQEASQRAAFLHASSAFLLHASSSTHARRPPLSLAGRGVLDRLSNPIEMLCPVGGAPPVGRDTWTLSAST